MTADPSELQALRRVKRKNLFVCAAVLLGAFPVHGLASGDFSLALALTYGGWSASFVAISVAVGRGWVSAKSTGMWTGPATLLAVTALIHRTGGPDSPCFPMLGSLPFAIAIFSPDSRLSTVAASVWVLASTVVLDVMAGLPSREMLLHVSSFGLLGAAAIAGGQTYRRISDAEKVAQQERLVAQQERLAVLEQLAESERRRVHAERERAEVERLVLVGQLATGVAHEVNNPLAFVKSNLGFLERELRNEGGPGDLTELREVLTETQQGVLRIQQIVMDLRRFARELDDGEEGRVEDAMDEAKRLASVRLRGLGDVSLDVGPGLPPVRLGQRHLVQVLLNLLLNAADAVEDTKPARRAAILVRARWVGEEVWLEVEDNGPGIPQEVLPRLFEPFFTTRPPGKGTGLGLALCREYASRCGGSLHAENRSEGGARFVLRVPVARESGPAAA
ncbi:histidine kinase [Archangium sp. Cb G35]|uniref:sensor histidine kinase n=1 Tax=Archangium sp. Cb G35 TaxID=1920190 RepID=UPI0009363243|nr:ATP-binding protein [Archangium sp. Cb G35]OJT17928.1 histidine kinase [Archangium sp. Cb G35]